MTNINFIIKKISEKNDENIIWSKNKYFTGEALLKKIISCRKIIKNKMKMGDLVAFQSDFNFNSIAFFIASLLEKLIIIPLPHNQKKYWLSFNIRPVIRFF